MEFHSSQKSKISTEMYLKEIYLFHDKNKSYPKAVDLVKELKFSKGTVSEMLKKLETLKLITYKDFEIKLTKKGMMEAKNVVRKYVVIKKFLSDVLKTPDDKIHEEACNLEHAFSDESVAKLNILNKILKK